MPWILDTDLVSILQRRTQPAYGRLQARLAQQPPGAVHLTIASFHEQTRGWMALLNRPRTGPRVVAAYLELRGLLSYYCRASLLPFDQPAQDRFEVLRQQRVRIGTMDLRIASIALTTGSVLLSRNLRDFHRVPGLVVEDWTR